MKTTVPIRSYDGTALEGDLLLVPRQRGAVLLIHGITADRHEAGLYNALIDSFSAHGLSSFAFDLRAHGHSEGQQQELTLSACINDILAAAHYLLSTSGASKLAIVACSFSGGLSIAASSLLPLTLNGMVLLNPRLDYLPWVTDSPFWSGETLTSEGSDRMRSDGFLERNGFRATNTAASRPSNSWSASRISVRSALSVT